MNENAEIFDMKEENMPRKQMNPKTKKFLVYLLCVIIGLAVAAIVIFLAGEIFSGAATPEEAIAEYQKAALLYDVDGMIEYSSEYNKTVLYGNRETTDRLLRAYLNKGYEGYTPAYTEEGISFQLISVIEFEPEDDKFSEIMEIYDQKVENGSEDIDRIAIVSMTVKTDRTETTRDYLAVKCGLRWYFGYAGVA